MVSAALHVNELRRSERGHGTRISLGGLSKFLGKPNQNALRPTNVAELVGVLIPDDVAHKLRAVRSKSFYRFINVVDSEHGSQISSAFTGAFR